MIYLIDIIEIIVLIIKRAMKSSLMIVLIVFLSGCGTTAKLREAHERGYAEGVKANAEETAKELHEILPGLMQIGRRQGLGFNLGDDSETRPCVTREKYNSLMSEILTEETLADPSFETFCESVTRSDGETAAVSP